MRLQPSLLRRTGLRQRFIISTEACDAGVAERHSNFPVHRHRRVDAAGPANWGWRATTGFSGKASKPTGVVAYLLAPDMDATLAAIERAGGAVVIPTTNVMGMGDFAQFRDPDGNVIGLWRDSGAG